MKIIYTISGPLKNKELNALYHSAWPKHSDMDFTDELNHTYFYVCGFFDQHLVGFAKVIWDGAQHGFILEPTVHPKYQRRGIGTQLLKECIKEAKLRNLSWLHVDFESDLTEFYRNAGFEHTEAGLVNLRK